MLRQTSRTDHLGSARVSSSITAPWPYPVDRNTRFAETTTGFYLSTGYKDVPELKAYTVAVINDLERDGLVARGRDEEARRRNLVALTPAGADARARLDARVEEAQDALLAPLSSAERRQLRDLLTRVVEHHREGISPARPTA